VGGVGFCGGEGGGGGGGGGVGGGWGGGVGGGGCKELDNWTYLVKIICIVAVFTAVAFQLYWLVIILFW